MIKTMKKIMLMLLSVVMIVPCLSCAQQKGGENKSSETVSEESDADAQPDSLSILVAGDLMQHSPQINAARSGNTYDYKECFKLVKPEINDVDLAIANFEVTLGGPPYKGYPCFSAPDEYLRDILDAGFDVLTTGNNHCLDSHQKGLERTIMMMDSLQVPHLGTYKDSAERERTYPLLVEKNGFRLVLLNFTYATNGLRVKEPNIVNYIDTLQITQDIVKAKSMNPDMIIALPHWGIEYAMTPAKPDKELADWLFSQGVDHIIGGHPHVLQPMELRNATAENGGNVLVYSLGNYLSNQYKDNTVGGGMVRLDFVKEGGKTKLVKCGYMLTYCSRPQNSGKRNYRIVPVEMDEELSLQDKNIRNKFVNTATQLFEKYNVNFGRY
jgi:poly-gamma-glutamate synthesis protein (capsule biosynthesis protein)